MTQAGTANATRLGLACPTHWLNVGSPSVVRGWPETGLSNAGIAEMSGLFTWTLDPATSPRSK
jgi:hypothetical protein